MKKTLVSLLLCAALLLPVLPVPAAAFSDISDPTTAEAAAVLQGMGVVTGVTANSFSPSSPLSRAQICTMIVNAMGLGDQVSSHTGQSLFTDVPPSAWHNGFVNLAYAQGVISGYGQGKFGPDDTVTYGHLSTILLRMLGYSTADIGTVWPTDFTSFCDKLGLSAGLSVAPNQPLTRGQAAVLIYRTLKQTVKGTGEPYYATINGVAGCEPAILLDISSTFGSITGLLSVLSLESGKTSYFYQSIPQSALLTGLPGILLTDRQDNVLGFIPDVSSQRNVTVTSATSTTLTLADGERVSIPDDAKLLFDGSVIPYRPSGYLNLDARGGMAMRLYLDDSGAVSYLTLTDDVPVTAAAAVATGSTPAKTLAKSLGIYRKEYTITKNGAYIKEDAIAKYDVAIYDSATKTMRVSDLKVTGYLAAAYPSVSSAATLTMGGHTFDVLQCAWDSLKGFKTGDRVTLLLTEDGKVASAVSPSTAAADMVGILAQDGSSVTLVGSNITLSAETMKYSEKDLGCLVGVNLTSLTEMRCVTPSAYTYGHSLDLDVNLLAGHDLAASCHIYEWAGKGYLYDLKGHQGGVSTSLESINWTDTIPSTNITYYHVNSAGDVDILLLEDLTGNCYEYGQISVLTGKDGIGTGSSVQSYSRAATLSNSTGVSEKYFFTPSATNGSYVGIALGHTDRGHEEVVKVRTLSRLSTSLAENFYLKRGIWYLGSGTREYPVATNVHIHLSDTNTWLSGSGALNEVLDGSYRLTAYYDRLAEEGGQIRVIKAVER